MIECDLGGDLMEQMWCTCGNPLRGSRDAIHQKPLRFPLQVLISATSKKCEKGIQQSDTLQRSDWWF